MYKRSKLLAIIIAMIIFPVSLFSATINIPSDQSTIQNGINAATDGDTVLVYPGTYEETIDFTGKMIVVKSLLGPELTTIIAPFTGLRSLTRSESDTATAEITPYTTRSDQPVVWMNSGEPKGAEISGFTITGGGYSGIWCWASSPTITNNIITENTSTYYDDGGGINLRNTSGSFISGNVIHGNRADTYGAGIHLEFSENDTISHNIFYDNIGYGDIRSLHANSIFYNNTIYPVTYSGITNQLPGIIYAKNNIIVDAPDYGIAVGSGGVIEATYNCIWNSGVSEYKEIVPGAGSINEDPLFVDPLNNDYTLQSSSPCIDAGDPDAFYNDIDGSRNDIGATPNLTPSLYVVDINFGPSATGHVVNNLTPSIYWTYFDSDGELQYQYEIQVGTDNDWTITEMWDSGPVLSSETSVIYDGAALSYNTTYYLRIRIHNGSIESDWAYSWFYPHIIWVINIPQDYPTIQEGIDNAINGDTILVGPGIYFANIDFDGKALVVISEKGPTKTFVRPSDEYIPMVIIDNGEGPGTVLSGFTIRNGSDNASTMMIGHTSEAVIENNIFRDNISEVINPLAVIKVENRAIIRYNLFFDNGGISCIWSDGETEIINNTMDSNERGVYSSNSSTILRNNIITNSVEYGTFGYFASYDYNNVWNNGSSMDPGPNGISADPLYVDDVLNDFNIRLASPCVDAGDPAPIYNDLNGTRNDIGALPFYYCGDIDLNNEVSISDIIFLINYYFAGGPPPTLFFKSDVNCDDIISLVDIIYLNRHILSYGSIQCCYY